MKLSISFLYEILNFLNRKNVIKKIYKQKVQKSWITEQLKIVSMSKKVLIRILSMQNH